MMNLTQPPLHFDFSRVNLEYLIQARDLARQNPNVGAVLLGISEELCSKLSTVSPEHLALIGQLKPPAVVLRWPSWWWDRLLIALDRGDPDELRTIFEHAATHADARSGTPAHDNEQ